MAFTCCNDERRKLVKNHPVLNGIDFIEVVDNPGDPNPVRQTILSIHFIKELIPGNLTQSNFIITGGERITSIKVIEAWQGGVSSPPSSPPNTDELKIMGIRVNKAGDFSTYTLHIIGGEGNKKPPDGFDPVLSSVNFSFKVLCSNNFDCKTPTSCLTDAAETPNINYLAKDYNSFRRLMLDRLSLLLSDWKERNAADIGVTLVELLAYMGDHLSYQQDAVATEAYIGTARRRVSAKRHARLADYYMHDGSNARCWVQVCIDNSMESIALTRNHNSETTKFITRSEGVNTVIQYNSDTFNEILYQENQVFELMHNSILYSEHNQIRFYTWGNKNCCLPKGTTSAYLLGNLTNLQAGDILIFMEVKGPETGNDSDADPAKRHAVRLTNIQYIEDPLGALVLEEEIESVPVDSAVPITKITWHIDDALPFPLCISTDQGGSEFDNVSIALGNIVLADHGITWDDDMNNPMLQPFVTPEINPILNTQLPNSSSFTNTSEPQTTPPRFQPKLKYGPLTQAASLKTTQPLASASGTMKWTIDEIKPEITLLQNNEYFWVPKKDLLNSDRNSRHFVVEIETDGSAHLRFGNNTHGARPESGSMFKACFRTGNGEIGNIGAEKIAHIISNDSTIYSNSSYITKVWNPLAAKGGLEAETIDEVRQKVGEAFKSQERAVTESDYSDLARKSNNTIQRAAADFRWTGSWYTAFVTLDRYGGKEVDATFAKKISKKLNTYRMAGQDLKIAQSQYVPLEIEMIVYINKEYDISDVRSAVLSVFTNGYRPNGKQGVFHPDNFTFGDTIYLSSFYAEAQAIEGVKYVDIVTFKRPGIKNQEALDSGKITFGHLEIPRLDNDPDYREHGVFNLRVKKAE